MLTIFLYRNFIKMSSQLNHMVPLFDGSNYCTWATSMTAFLCSQHLWGIVSSREGRPSDLPSGRAAVAATGTSPAQLAIPPTWEEVSERQRAQREWAEKDDQALGMIQLWLSHSLYSLCGLSAWRTWKNLEEQFGKLLHFHNLCQLCLCLCLSCDYLSTNSILRCTTVDYHIIFVPLFTQTFLQDSPSYSQVLPYVTTIWSSSVDINLDSLLYISTLDFAFQGMGMHGTIFTIYHMFIPCLRNSL